MKYIIVGALIVLAFALGSWTGINAYKSTCEDLGTATGDRWLECTK